DHARTAPRADSAGHRGSRSAHDGDKRREVSITPAVLARHVPRQNTPETSARYCAVRASRDLALDAARRVVPARPPSRAPGTFRAELLATSVITERRVTVEELRAATRFWLVNSVRGWISGVLIE